MINIPHEYIRSKITDAIALGASDLHIQTLDDSLFFTAHVDQFRHVLGEIKENKDMYFKEIKKFFNFKMGMLGQIDDQRTSLKEFGYDFRGVIYPVKNGENITLRLLKRDKEFSLNNYSLQENAKQELKKAIGKNEGLILISGPTGSGKTTLLYSALGSLDRVKKNVLTVEDPIEYTIPFVNQTQVDKEKGITFSSILRAYMRAKPNVIMIGEIRDEETAHAAIHAANTGHLVFSTVHAVDAKRVFDRMKDLGISEQMLQENVLFSSAQRLIPKNCTHCLEEDKRYQHSGSKMELEKLFDESFQIYHSKGCQNCHDGYHGMQLVFEYIFKNKKSQKNFEMSENIYSQIKSLLKKGTIDFENAMNLI